MPQEEELTLGSVSVAIYKDIVDSLSHQIIVESLIKEQITRQQFGKLTKSTTPQPIFDNNLLSASNNSGNGGNSLSQTPSQCNSRISSPNTELLTRNEFVNVLGRDIFGNEKVPDSARYFTCTNCSRKISGNRFAAHIDRCLGGRQRKWAVCSLTKERAFLEIITLRCIFTIDFIPLFVVELIFNCSMTLWRSTSAMIMIM